MTKDEKDALKIAEDKDIEDGIPNIDIDFLKRTTLDNDISKTTKKGQHFGGTAKGGKAAKMFGGNICRIDSE